MSYTVRHATLAAVRASISIPVFPVTPHVHSTWTPTRPSTRSPANTGSHSTLALVMLRGWHIGIRSLVRFAAITPATRAQAKTSPFFAVPPAIMSSVSGCMAMNPSATATRSVSAFCETSTMRTSPFSSMCVSFWSVMSLSFMYALARRGDARYVFVDGKEPPAGETRLPPDS